MKSYQVQSQNCSLQVYERGNFQSPISILFLHGGPGSGAQPLMDLPAFQKLESLYHCIYFDQRGSGSSLYSLENNITIEDITTDVKEIAQHIKKQQQPQLFALWGGSFGGYLAALCMERFPTEFDCCILSSPAIHFHRSQALAFYQKMKAPYEQRFTAPATDTTTSKEDITPEAFFSDEQMRKFIFSSYNPSDSLRHICAMGSWFFNHFFLDCFTNLKTPTLLLQGKMDPICDFQAIDSLVTELHNPCITYHLYETCGHAIFEEEEEAFVGTIKTFLDCEKEKHT